jgi:hypothetical protein
MARVYANTLDEPDREQVEAKVLSAIENHPESSSWDVFILQIRGLPGVYVSIECGDRVVKSWLFGGVNDPIQELIGRELQGSFFEGRPPHPPVARFDGARP